MLVEKTEASSSPWYFGAPLLPREQSGLSKALKTSPNPSHKQQPMHDDGIELSVSAHRAVARSHCRPRLTPQKMVEEALPGRSSSYIGKSDRGRSTSPASVASTASSIPSFTASVNSLPSTPSMEYLDLLGSRHGSPASARPTSALELDSSRTLHIADATSRCGVGSIAVAAEVEPDIVALNVLKKSLADRLYCAQPDPPCADSGANITELLSLRLRLASALRESTCGSGVADSVGANVAEIHSLRLRLANALRKGNCGSGAADSAASSADDALAGAASAVVLLTPSPRFVAVVCDGLAYLLPSAASSM